MRCSREFRSSAWNDARLPRYRHAAGLLPGDGGSPAIAGRRRHVSHRPATASPLAHRLATAHQQARQSREHHTTYQSPGYGVAAAAGGRGTPQTITRPRGLPQPLLGGRHITQPRGITSQGRAGDTASHRRLRRIPGAMTRGDDRPSSYSHRRRNGRTPAVVRDDVVPRQATGSAPAASVLPPEPYPPMLPLPGPTLAVPITCIRGNSRHASVSAPATRTCGRRPVTPASLLQPPAPAGGGPSRQRPWSSHLHLSPAGGRSVTPAFLGAFATRRPARLLGYGE